MDTFNFVKVADRHLISDVQTNGTVDEFFEGFFRAFEGNPALMQNLADPSHSIAGYTSQAKARLKQFLSDPNP